MQRLVYMVDIDEEITAIDGLLEALDTTVQLVTDCNVIGSRLESPDEVVENGELEN